MRGAIDDTRKLPTTTEELVNRCAFCTQTAGQLAKQQCTFVASRGGLLGTPRTRAHGHTLLLQNVARKHQGRDKQSIELVVWLDPFFDLTL